MSCDVKLNIHQGLKPIDWKGYLALVSNWFKGNILNKFESLPNSFKLEENKKLYPLPTQNLGLMDACKLKVELIPGKIQIIGPKSHMVRYQMSKGYNIEVNISMHVVSRNIEVLPPPHNITWILGMASETRN